MRSAVAGSDTAVRITVVHPRELGDKDLDAWRELQRADPELQNPFLSPEFTQAVARVRPATRVAVLEDRGGAVGFLPLEYGWMRIGRPIGPGVSDAQGLVHARGLQWRMRELVAGCGLDVLAFDHLIGSQVDTLDGEVARSRSPIIEVSGGYAGYLEARQRATKKIIKTTLYKERKLGRDLGEIRFDPDSRDAHAMSALIRWKSNQYRRTGRRDRFAVDWIRRLVWDLFEAGGPPGMLSVLYADERVVAAHFGLRSQTSLSCWFPAYDPGLARYSPGLALHLRMVEAAADAGIRHLDLGKGDEQYKQSLKTGDLVVGEGRATRPSVGAVVHAMRHVPVRSATNVILRRPRLRRAARSTLKCVGSLRSSAVTRGARVTPPRLGG
jgi:CelD/BcsL family acetyltransferase involved in cellulose biosynthesis